jgi:DeoR family fructose operon transcriptional repressor
VAEGATLFLDGSTTCLELARQLAGQRSGLTVATNSLLVALEAGRGRHHTVIVVGGQYDADSGSCVGPASETWASHFCLQQAFLSTKGFIPAEGTFESSLDNFRIKQIVARQCSSLTLLVDHSKFGQRALCKVLDTSQIHTVITDAAAPAEELDRLRRDGKQVLVAASASETSVGTAACR